MSNSRDTPHVINNVYLITFMLSKGASQNIVRKISFEKVLIFERNRYKINEIVKIRSTTIQILD